MKKTTVACAVLFYLYLLPSVADAQGAVVVGQTPEGRNVITTIIELKYLDPYYAADLLAALGYGGSVIPVGPAPLMGSPRTAGRSQNPRQTNRNQRGNDNGYGGYQEANRRSQQYPGYQSPYDYN